jgi:hypothetical protein
VLNAEAKTLPRGRSRTQEEDSGRCLIALERAGVVYVRNAYRAKRHDIVVENMREFLRDKRGATMRGTGLTGVDLERLKRLNFKVYRGPFLVRIPWPNCISELKPAAFEEIWAKQTSSSPMESHTLRAAQETALLRYIRGHYEERRITEDWTPNRVRRICHIYQLTPEELAAFVCWTPGTMNLWMNGAGMGLPGPVALLLYLLENFHLGTTVFPDLPIKRSAAA